jgi:hypothetical protein
LMVRVAIESPRVLIFASKVLVSDIVVLAYSAASAAVRSLRGAATRGISSEGFGRRGFRLA